MTPKNAAEFIVLDGSTWVRRGGQRTFERVPGQGWDPSLYLADEVVLTGEPLRPTPVPQAVSDLISAGLSVGGRARKADSITFIHPSHWGVLRLRPLQQGAHRHGATVRCIPLAVAVQRARPDGGRVVVLECGELSTTATLVDSAGSIITSVHEPALGLADVEDPERAMEFGRLFPKVGDAATVVIGPHGPALDLVAASLGRDVVVMAGASSLETAGKPVIETHRMPTVDRRWLLAGAGVVLVVLAVCAYLVLRPKNSGDVTAEVRTVHLATGKTDVPSGWSWTLADGATSDSARIEMRNTAGPNQRIIAMAKRLQDSSLTIDQVAQILQKSEMSVTGSRFTEPLKQTFAGRQTLAYSEFVDRDKSEARWFVLLDRGVQLLVGCQFIGESWGGLQPPCEQVVGSITATR